MTDTAESLDPLRLPLQGERLIEASAGTGKTFTIAAHFPYDRMFGYLVENEIRPPRPEPVAQAEPATPEPPGARGRLIAEFGDQDDRNTTPADSHH